MFDVNITETALKTAKKIPKEIRKEIIKKSQIIRNTPLAGEKLKGKYNFLYSYHLRIKKTSYRLIYEIDKRKKIIIVRYLGSRENLYRNLDKMFLRKLP